MDAAAFVSCTMMAMTVSSPQTDFSPYLLEEWHMKKTFLPTAKLTCKQNALSSHPLQLSLL